MQLGFIDREFEMNIIRCRACPVLRAHRSTLRKLDFTTGKRRNRGELPKIREADSLGQRSRAVE